jgi:hypothetical protein
MARQRPGIVDADRARAGTLASLVERSAENDAALDALVFAYESLDRPGRRALMAAIADDARHPAPALAALLAVEQSPVLQSRLRELLRNHLRIEWSAYAWGTSNAGGAALVQELVGGVSEALLLTWKHFELDRIELEAPNKLSFWGEGARPVEPSVAVDAVLPMIWRYIRRGRRLPSGSERFAGFLALR